MSNNAIVKFEATLAQVMPKVRAGFPMSIPDHKLQRATDRLMFAIRSTATANGKIYDCTAASVANCICLSALTGLLPGGAVPVVDLIPRQRSFKGPRGWQKVTELNWQIGWRGYQALGEKLGVSLEPRLVFKTDKFDMRYGLTPDLIHVPDLDGERTWDNVRGAYIIVRLPNGTVKFTDLTRSEIEKRRAVSQAWQYDEKNNKTSSPWSQWPLEMALKTIISYAARRGFFPLDEEFTTAMEMDGRESPDDLVIIEATTTPAKALEAPAKALADTGGMAALAGHLDERSAQRTSASAPSNEPILIEQPPPEHQAETEALPIPAGESDPQPADGSDLPLGGGSQDSRPVLSGIYAAEQRLPKDVVKAIRGDIGIRVNGRLENIEPGRLDSYFQELGAEYSRMYPE